ncbi:MAG: GNAT family N-acetyltransferase [Myxococcales bacterium]
MSTTPVLRSLQVGDEPQLIAAHRQMAAEHFDFALGYREGMPFADYLAALEDERNGRNLSAGHVPATFLVAMLGDTLVGRLSFRHSLNDHLSRVGGHVGFGVLPEYRCRGIATAMLRAGVELAAELDLTEVLVTCSETNYSSSRVIERCGGRYSHTYANPSVGIPKRHYWISTGASKR